MRRIRRKLTTNGTLDGPTLHIKADSRSRRVTVTSDGTYPDLGAVRRHSFVCCRQSRMRKCYSVHDYHLLFTSILSLPLPLVFLLTVTVCRLDFARTETSCWIPSDLSRNSPLGLYCAVFRWPPRLPFCSVFAALEGIITEPVFESF